MMTEKEMFDLYPQQEFEIMSVVVKIIITVREWIISAGHFFGINPAWFVLLLYIKGKSRLVA